MIRISILILVGSLAGTSITIGFVIREDRLSQQLQRSRIALTERRASLEAKARRAQQAVLSVDTEESVSVVTNGFRPSVASVQNSQSTPIALSMERAAEPSDPLVNDPALQNLYLAAERANLDSLYTPLYRRLGLSLSQIAAFRDLTMKREEQRMDLADVQQSHELDNRDAALVALRRRVSEDFDAKLLRLLGQSGYQQFNDYDRTLPVLRLVNQFAGAVALEGQPLTAPQADALTLALAEASPPYTDGGTADPNRVDWPVALAGSEKVLSPSQQQSFLNMAPRYPIEDGIVRAAPPVPVVPPSPAGG